MLDIRKKRLQLKQASESKLLEIQMEKNKQKDDLENMENSEKIKTIQRNLQREIQITTVIQHMFQNLILGSKANWAEDPALKEIVLQLEKNLTTIQWEFSFDIFCFCLWCYLKCTFQVKCFFSVFGTLLLLFFLFFFLSLCYHCNMESIVLNMIIKVTGIL